MNADGTHLSVEKENASGRQGNKIDTVDGGEPGRPTVLQHPRQDQLGENGHAKIEGGLFDFEAVVM